MTQPGQPSSNGAPAAGVAALAPWDFLGHARQAGCSELVRGQATTLQINVGRRCNQVCRHCHVGAGPQRSESMSRAVAEGVMAVLAASPSVRVVDLTGGAPELNPSFRWIVQRVRELGKEVIDRCNLTVLLEPDMEGLDRFLAAHQVHVVASLPCYGAENVDAQRGKGVFERSIRVLKQLNALGYGDPGSDLQLDLVYNPGGAFLPPPQSSLQAAYQEKLLEQFGVRFNRLLAFANLPISRFADHLTRHGRLSEYMSLLVRSFNPATVGEVMCRSLVSVGHDGKLFDCDFNQMLSLELGASGATSIRSVWDLQTLDELTGQPVATAGHCFGCTAGAGSSCGGALAEPEG